MRTLIIGAGIAGLRAAALLQQAGGHVDVVDKGRRHGGRMATRRVEDAVFDTGVLDLAAVSETFRTALDAARAAGHAEVIGPDGTEPGAASQWRGAPMMRSLPTAMAERVTSSDDGGVPVTVQLATTVTALSVRDGQWTVTLTHDGASMECTSDALVLTAPAPQSVALLRTSDGLASDATLAQLEAITYAPSLTVLTRPRDRTLQDLPHDPGSALQRGGADGEHDLARLHHNGRTGASKVLALTLQATATFSAQHLDDDRDAAAARLAEQASGLVGTTLEVVHVHGWRYAQVTRGIDLPALRDDTSGAPLVLAGDLFETHSDVPTGIRPQGVERAYLSGGAAATLLSATWTPTA